MRELGLYVTRYYYLLPRSFAPARTAKALYTASSLPGEIIQRTIQRQVARSRPEILNPARACWDGKSRDKAVEYLGTYSLVELRRKHLVGDISSPEKGLVVSYKAAPTYITKDSIQTFHPLHPTRPAVV